jgi:hypothetical protein
MSLQTGEDQSELLALREEVEELRYELDAQREELNRELVRRAFRIGQLELSLQSSEQEYQSSLSWRVTKPLRIAKALLRELRKP